MIVWMAYEPFSRMILVLWHSWTRNSLQAEKFLKHWLGHMVGIQYRQRVPHGTAMHVEVLGLSITGIMAPYSDGESYTVIEG
jgi:hypothetical protein